MNRILCTLAAVALIAAVPAVADGKLGDPAPALQIAHWVKGGPVDMSKGKGEQVYVVEFWATWCGPCRKSIPHLTELAKKHKGKVTFIGVSDEKLETVEPFVTKMGDKMDYVVAIDKNEKTSAAYMKAFGRGGIPHAFIVDKSGNIAWEGHPMDNMDKALEKIIAGTYDAKAAGRAAEDMRKAQAMMREYFQMVSSSGKEKEAAELGQKIVETAGDNPQAMNELSWTIMTHPQVVQRDLDLAMKAAEKAMKGSEKKDPAIIDTYARALFMKGKKDEAIKWQKKAIELCEDDAMKSQLEEALKEYEAD